jgi:hypothetical protein
MRRTPYKLLSPRTPATPANPATLPRVVFVAIAMGAFACALDLGGLEIDPSSHPVSTSLGDATVISTGAAPDASSPAVPADSSEDARASAPAPDAATGRAPSPIVDANMPDVVSGDGGSVTTDPSDPCDVDQDGFKSASAACGGTDCCDTDGRAFPGETTFYTTPDTCGSFDYDCNGANDPEFNKVDCTLGVFVCNGSGFAQAPPACGVAATFDTCNLEVICVTSQSQATQGCR